MCIRPGRAVFPGTGPLAGALGVSGALWIGVGAIVVPTLAVMCVRDVRTITIRSVPIEAPVDCAGGLASRGRPSPS